jgi:predicted PurR-regulated permease PerM
VYTLGIMGVIVFGLYTLSLLQGLVAFAFHVLTPFMTALILAYILAPVVVRLQHHLKLGRVVGTLVIYVIIFLALCLLLALLIPILLSQVIKVFDALKEGLPLLLTKLSGNKHFQVDAELIQALQNKLKEIHVDYEKIIASLLPTIQKLASGGFGAVGGVARNLFSGAWWVVGFLSFLVFVGFISFYMILDWERIGPLIRKMVPPRHRGQVFDILAKIDIAVGGFLRGRLIVAAIVGSSFAIGLFCLGFFGFPALRNYCILIGAGAGVAGFIPYLGSVIGVAPAIMIVLFTEGLGGDTKVLALIAVLALFALIQTVEGFILHPKILGKGAGLHPIVVLLALIAGAQFGIGGLIIAVPAASIIRVLFRELYWLPIERQESLLIEDPKSNHGKDGNQQGCPT